MGRGGRRGGGQRLMKRDFKEKRDDTWIDYRHERVNFEKSNELRSEEFEDYYRGQEICPDDEWDEFLKVLRTPLPITFRINGSSQVANDLRARLEADFFSEFAGEGDKIQLDGEDCEPPRPMLWYPDKLAWHMNFSRQQLRKQPVLVKLHDFMKRENETGSITRQEAVSMVPPLFLDVKPHHQVLDTCAAPGSKTFQLLEMLHAGPEAATGFVVANDADAKRCNLLTHQTKRMCSPCLLVTNHEAQQFPIIRPSSRTKRQVHGQVQFDRILCDVPCSGDGTLRKAPDIWRRWNLTSGHALHNLQLQITLQACKLLRVGGRLVYSTCTFNPIEDEAVVATILRITKGALRLVDVGDTMPSLKRMPGKRSWRVKLGNQWIDSWESVADKDTKILPTMFPQSSDDFPMERTMRFLPHHQDTGGFYVAVLEKVGDCSDVHAPNPRKRNKNKFLKPQEKAAQAANAEGGHAPSADSNLEIILDPPANSTAAEVKTEAPGSAEAAEARTADGATASGADGNEDERRSAPAGSTELEWTMRGGGARGRADGGVGKWKGLDPVVPITDPALLQPIVDFYGIEPSFPLLTHVITRCYEARENPKRLYYVSDAIRHLLMMDDSESLKITSAGLKLLERQVVKDGSNPCNFRISQEGLPFLLPHVTKQRLALPTSEFLALLEQRTVRFPKSVPYTTVRPPQTAKEEGATPAEATQDAADGGDAAGEADREQLPMLSDESTLEQLARARAGGVVVTLRDDHARELGLPTESQKGDTGGCLTSEAPLALTCWRARATVNVLVSKLECLQMAEKVRLAQAAAAAQGAEEPASKRAKMQ